jgi:predicted nucleotidyltransferase
MKQNTGSLLDEIRGYLAGSDLSKAYLFGSRSRGEAGDESDVDMVLVLNRPGPFASAREHRDEILAWRRRLRPIAIRYGLDLIVFTQEDWKRFTDNNSSFARELQKQALEVA